MSIPGLVSLRLFVSGMLGCQVGKQNTRDLGKTHLHGAAVPERGEARLIFSPESSGLTSVFEQWVWCAYVYA